MNRRNYLHHLLYAALMIVAVLACRQTASTSEPKAPVAPLNISGDLTKIDVCQAIPKEDIEAVMGRKLTSPPKHFEYYETHDTGGCWYEASKDSSGEAHYGYVVLTPLDIYDKQPLYNKLDVNGIGDRAYFNNGADARQLWVKIDNKVAFVVAFGDVPKEDGAKSLAKLVAAAIK